MVNFAIKYDKMAKLKFTPLQSPIGIQLKQQYNIPLHVDSVIFIENGKAKIYANAALSICKYLDYPAKLLVIFKILPRFISNKVYKWIAKNRYSWFGKTESCMVPNTEVKNRFL